MLSKNWMELIFTEEELKWLRTRLGVDGPDRDPVHDHVRGEVQSREVVVNLDRDHVLLVQNRVRGQNRAQSHRNATIRIKASLALEAEVKVQMQSDREVVRSVVTVQNLDLDLVRALVPYQLKMNALPMDQSMASEL